MRGTLQERFWAKVEQGDLFACWKWKGAIGGDGYPHIGVRIGAKFKMRHACRVLWELVHGPIPHGMSVLHSCDDPQCVSPHHLHLGTKIDNMREMSERGRGTGGRFRIRPFVEKRRGWREKLAACKPERAGAESRP